jgi:hypothetical protein
MVGRHAPTLPPIRQGDRLIGGALVVHSATRKRVTCDRCCLASLGRWRQVPLVRKEGLDWRKHCQVQTNCQRGGNDHGTQTATRGLGSGRAHCL